MGMSMVRHQPLAFALRILQMELDYYHNTNGPMNKCTYELCILLWSIHLQVFVREAYHVRTCNPTLLRLLLVLLLVVLYSLPHHRYLRFPLPLRLRLLPLPHRLLPLPHRYLRFPLPHHRLLQTTYFSVYRKHWCLQNSLQSQKL